MSQLSTITIFILMLLINSLSWAGEDKEQGGFFESIFGSAIQQKEEIIDPQPKPVTNDSSKTDKTPLPVNQETQKKTSIDKSSEIVPKTIQPAEKQLPKQIIDSGQTKPVELDSISTNEKQQSKDKPAEISYSDNKAEKGLAIIMEVDRRDTGWQDSQSTLQMILKNRHGDEHTRHLKMKTMEVQGDGDKSLSIFNSPKDIKGTAFLSFTHALDPDEQWLFLPAVKRVKRISSRNKSGPYLGSEFAFEDLSSFEVKKYKYKYLHDEVFGGIDSFVIETAPLYKHSGYTRTILWIDKQRYILLKIAYYDRKNSLLKTQTFHGYNQYLQQYWRPDEMRMVNHNNGKSTTLLIENYKFRKGLTKRAFDKNALKRAR